MRAATRGRQGAMRPACALGRDGSSSSGPRSSVRSSAVVHPQQQQNKAGAARPRPAKLLLDSFAQFWLPRLVQQQEEVQDTYSRVAQLKERLASEVTSYKARITSAVQDIITGPSTPSSLKAGAQQQQQHTLAQPPPLDLALLDRPGTPSGASAIAGLLEASPEAELAVLARSIQNTNETVREVESLFSATNTTIELLQEGADERDQVQDEVSAALLQYADDLEQREAEQRAAMAAWEAEQARVAAEAAAYAAEQAAIAEAEVRRQEQEQAAARAAAEAAEREAERLAELERLRAPTCIKVDVGVQMKTRPGEDVVLVGSHPAFGSWDLGSALRLSWSDGHVWRASVEVPPDCDALEYKAVVVSGGSPVWEKGSNQKVDLQGSKDVSLFHVFKA